MANFPKAPQSNNNKPPSAPTPPPLPKREEKKPPIPPKKPLPMGKKEDLGTIKPPNLEPKKDLNSQKARSFDREDKPFSEPTKPPIAPKNSQKRMFTSGRAQASQFQSKPHKTTVPPTPKMAKKTPEKAKNKPKTHATDPQVPNNNNGTILPPTSFRAKRISPGFAITIVVVLALLAAGTISYFFFKTEMVAFYNQTLDTLGIKQTETVEIADTETDINTAVEVLPTLENITFSETSDPASGTEVYTGQTITYTLTLHNKADSEITGLQVINEIPEGTHNLLILSSPAEAVDNTTDTVVDFANIKLAGGQSQTIRFQVDTKSDLDNGTVITNKATLVQNGSRKISNNNNASNLEISGDEVAVLPVEIEEETSENKVDTDTPAPTPTATPVPTATVTPEAEAEPIITQEILTENLNNAKADTTIEATESDEIKITLLSTNTGDASKLNYTVSLDGINDLLGIAYINNTSATNSQGETFVVNTTETLMSSDVTVPANGDATLIATAKIADAETWKSTSVTLNSNEGRSTTINLETPEIVPETTPTVTPVPTVTPAPEEANDEAAPEDMTTVETGGNSLYYMLLFSVLAGITGISLLVFRRWLLSE